jgi:putative phosphonate metabolism protein
MTIRSPDAAGAVPRFALYWAPASGSPLAALGAAWLGRDAGGDDVEARPVLAGFRPERLAELTAEPRRYGLHATLKPPFALAQGTDEGRLIAALAATARAAKPVQVPGLRLALLERFLALVPAGPCPALDALAARCVMDFDRFRRPATEAELARRRSARLSALEETYLARWGYPYVLDRFRFHVSLTGPLEAAEAERLMPELERYFAPVLGTPFEIGDIALFVQPAPVAPFSQRGRFILRTQRRRLASNGISSPRITPT